MINNEFNKTSIENGTLKYTNANQMVARGFLQNYDGSGF